MVKMNAIFFFFSILIISSVVALEKDARSPNACKSNKDCKFLNICDMKTNHCKHRPISQIGWVEGLGYVVLIIGSGISNAGGIQGGGLLVPILILVLFFETDEAIPISKCMIFFGALSSFLLELKSKNPFRDTHAVDYNICLMIVPFLLFGTMLGVTLNKALPPLVILIGLTVILIFYSVKTFIKAVKLYRHENDIKAKKEEEKKIRESQSKAIGPNMNEDNNLLIDESDYEDEEIKDVQRNKDQVDLAIIKDPEDPIHEYLENYEHSQILEKEIEKDRHFPWIKFVIMISCSCCLILIALLKGSPIFKSIAGIVLRSVGYWLVYCSYAVFAVGVSIGVGFMVYKEYTFRQSVGFRYTKYDVKWTIGKFFLFPVIGVLVGSVSGLMGVGGGLILGPVLLDLNIHPLVAASTNIFLILFTSSSTTIQFSIHGQLEYLWGLTCAVCGVIGSLGGTYMLQYAVAKTGRFSLLVFCLASVLGLSALVLPINEIFRVIKLVKSHVNIWKFHDPY